MIIDPHLKLIFIHIPKTGGTSLHHWLSSNNQTVNLWGVQPERNLDYAHLTLNQLNQLNLVPNINDYFIFAFVRNPYHRIYSAYLQPFKQRQPDLEFHQFLELYIRPMLLTTNHSCQPELVHIRPMVDFVTTDNQLNVNLIGKMEQWQESVYFLKNKFGLSGLPPQLNVSSKQHKLSGDELINKVYNREQLDLINQVYRLDFIWFGYQMI